MCAIAGVIGSTAADLDILDGMAKTMIRRGPDQSGIWTGPGIALLHTRLAVIDPEGGQQPMTLCHNSMHYAMVYNGELYNTPELRHTLRQLGHSFFGHSDTEVLLHAYAQWGADCLERLNGIFAFGIWTQEMGQLFLARDRIGVKPLFFTQQAGQFLFASELKTLLAHPGVTPRVDQQGVAEVMLLGPGRTPGCGVFQGIEELEPGCCAWFDGKRLRLRRYWRLEDYPYAAGFAETRDHVRE